MSAFGFDHSLRPRGCPALPSFGNRRCRCRRRGCSFQRRALRGSWARSDPRCAPTTPRRSSPATSVPSDAQPIAQAYAGHQFGGFSPQLGDGRCCWASDRPPTAGAATSPSRARAARLLARRRRQGRHRADAARGADRRGHARAGHSDHAMLAVAATGEPVYRERPLPGAVLTRVAASHLRVGTFQFFAMARRFSTPAPPGRPRSRATTPSSPARPMRRWRRCWRGGAAAGGADRAVDERRLHPRRDEHRQHDDLRRDHRLRPLRLHGSLRPAAVFSSIDHGGRYAYGNQPADRALEPGAFRRTLLPLLADADDEWRCSAWWRRRWR